jgi:hypothetical protein
MVQLALLVLLIVVLPAAAADQAAAVDLRTIVTQLLAHTVAVAAGYTEQAVLLPAEQFV